MHYLQFLLVNQLAIPNVMCWIIIYNHSQWGLLVNCILEEEGYLRFCLIAAKNATKFYFPFF